MEDLNDLYYFVQIVNYGGFAPASRVLGIPKSKLSRRLAMLEERLHVRLIERSTRHFTVSEIGKTYYQHCLAMLIEAQAAQAAIEAARAEPRGKIRITCPVLILQTHIGAMLADFMAQYPLLTIELEATSRQVDVISEGVDLAIYVRPPPLQDSNLVMRILSDCGQSLVASPTLLQQYGRLPLLPNELNGLPSISRPGPQASCWALYCQDNRQVVVYHTPRFVTTDMIALREAAIAGVGVVQLPLMALYKQLEEGSLIKLLPEWAPMRELIHVVFPSRRGLLPSIRLLIDYLAQRFANLETTL
ncbi:LysR family transcriptional regulator [Serratia sp. UGAL515B_01]|uniref:LysR family transcriptional regulator n=1 Tax=Serratia sp. UGAL515B_01 TaxID=2986763 RepID=UPI0029558028|nr:LysR family transcriptional regulator [Serratia sp. UGAL515B_01]WON77073.1 LysR family transcriptional regulator [Serratia sp. UGAL515B_01]